MPALTFRIPAYVPANELLLRCIWPLPILFSTELEALPAQGPAQVRLKPCVSTVPPPAAMVTPRRGLVTFIVAPICHVPPSSVT